MGRVASRTSFTKVGIRDGDRNLQKAHSIQETVAHSKCSSVKMSLGAKPFSIPLGATQALIRFPVTPAPFSSGTRAFSHTFRSPFHVAQTMAASSNFHHFELLEKSHPMQNPHRRMTCSYDSRTHHLSPREVSESGHFIAIPSEHEADKGTMGNLPHMLGNTVTTLSFQTESRSGICKDKTGRWASQKYLVEESLSV